MSEWKETEIGKIPGYAQLRKLGDCLSHVIDYRGKTPKKLGSDWVETGIPTISAKNVHDGKLTNHDDIRFVTEEVYKKWMKDDLKIGDCLIASEGATLGEHLYWDFDFPVVLGQRLFALRVNSKILYPKYLYAFINSAQFQNQIHGRASGTSVFGLRQTELLDMVIPVIPINEQIGIGDLNYNLNKKIDLLHRQNKTLEQLAEALFRQWFVENVESSWGKDVLGNLFDIGIGRTPPRKEQYWFSTNPNDLKWVSIKDMGGCGIYIDTTSEYLTQEAVERFSIPVIPENTVILSFKMTIGRLAITIEKMLSNEAIAHFKQKAKSNLFPEFLYLFLKTYRWEELGSTSSIVEAINSQMIKEMELVIPDQKKLKDFQELTNPSFEKIKANQNQIHTLSQLRDTLLPKLMSGEMRVK